MKRSGGFQTVIFLHFLLPVARKEDQKLALDQPQEYGKVNSVCQLCYNLSRDLGHGDMNFLWNLSLASSMILVDDRYSQRVASRFARIYFTMGISALYQ